MPHALDLRDKFVIVLGPVTAQCRLAHVESAPPWQFDVRAFMRNLA